MIEHVRRRALLCKGLSEVIVATCDKEIADVVGDCGGKVIMTSVDHNTGVERVAEAVDQVECTHVMVLQGDEPLIVPENLSKFVSAVSKEPDICAWNAVSPFEDESDFENRSIIKCVISLSGRILVCSRRTPCVSDASEQRKFIRKILGLMAFGRKFMKEILAREDTPYGVAEYIEQSRILEYDFQLQSVEFPRSYPSVNVLSDVAFVEDCLRKDEAQRQILRKVLNMGSQG